MFLKQLILFIILTGVAVLLLNIKMFFKKKGKLEKSCTAKHRMMHQKGIDKCESCSNSPMECERDEKEHHEFVHKVQRPKKLNL